MKVLIVSGIWPPDVGGPATHGPDFGNYLVARGHDVRAVASTPDGRPEPASFPIRGVRRDTPRAVRIPSALLAAAGAARGRDVAYATGGMYTRTALAAYATGTPLVIKLVNDPAYERARNLGLFSGTIDDFQDKQTDLRIRSLVAARNASLRLATRIVTPGRYLKRIAIGWGLPEDRFQVVPNPAPPVDMTVPREELRRRFDMDGITFVFAGRFVVQKNVPLVIRALSYAPDTTLILIGEGDQLSEIRKAIVKTGLQDRVVVQGPRPREEAMQWVRAADAAVLSSDWEGFPHAAVEALSVGTPIISTSVGAVPEIVDSGANGLLVPRGDWAAMGAALRSFASHPELAARLRYGAQKTGDRFAPERTFSTIEDQLALAISDVTPSACS